MAPMDCPKILNPIACGVFETRVLAGSLPSLKATWWTRGAYAVMG